MHKIITALFAIALMAGSASASDKTDVMVTVRHFVDSFNKGDEHRSILTVALQKVANGWRITGWAWAKH